MKRCCRAMRRGGAFVHNPHAHRDVQGRVIGWIASMADVADRKRVEDALRVALEEAQKARSAAEAASRAKDRFIAGCPMNCALR